MDRYEFYMACLFGFALGLLLLISGRYYSERQCAAKYKVYECFINEEWTPIKPTPTDRTTP